DRSGRVERGHAARDGRAANLSRATAYRTQCIHNGDVSHEYRNGCARTNAQPTSRSRTTAIFTQAAGPPPGPQARPAGRGPDGRRVAPDRGAQPGPGGRRLLSTVTIVARPSRTGHDRLSCPVG